MTKEYLESILTEYGVAFTDSLADRLLKEFEPCEDVAKERYEDLCEYFGGTIDILKHREDFKAWLDRMRWHVYKADELLAENNDLRDQLAMRDRFKQESCDNSVSRQAVNTLIDELARAISDERCCISRGRSTATIMRDILHLPPVTPTCEEREKGECPYYAG